MNTATVPLVERTVVFHEDPAASGLEMRLYEAETPGGPLSVAARTPATPLTDAETAALLARLPAMPSTASELPFSLRPASSPPPRTGVAVSEALAAAALVPATPAAGPLTIVRHAPDGELSIAPPLSVTFSRPMVALGAVAEMQRVVTAGESAGLGPSFPATVTPTPAGRWRWLGTQTLIFEPDGRFPMATAYTVQVPAGTHAADGTALATPLTWTFGTPAPSVVDSLGVAAVGTQSASRVTAGMTPSGLEPLLGLAFDQRVRPEDALESTRLAAAGATVPVRLATPEEVNADREAAAWLARQEPDRALIVRPVAPLARSTVHTLTVATGFPSAEGPRVTTKDVGYAFHTYGPLKVSRATCWYGGACPPNSPWGIELTNPLDAAAFDPATVTVTPAVAGLQIYAQGESVVVSGAFEGRKSYTVHLPPGLKDTFGQTLGVPQDVRLDIGPADRTLTGPPGQMVVVDPIGPARVSFFTTNHRALRVEVSVVQPSDWAAWQAWLERYRYEDANRPALPGRSVGKRVVTITKSPDELAETELDLAPYLKDGLGQLLIHVEPTVQPPERWARQEWFGWVQATHLGVVGFVEGEALTAWVTDLVTGRPAGEAVVSLVTAGESASGGGVAGGASPLPQGRDTSTGADGLARLALPPGEADLLIARRGADVALLPANPEGWRGGGWERRPANDSVGWYVLDDRGIYKPGETAHIRGWLRRMEGKKGGDVRVLAPQPATVTWTLTSSMGNPLGEGTATVTTQGGFTFDLPIPTTPDLGTAQLEIRASAPGLDEQTTYHGVQIEEFRTPEFEVVTTAGAGPYVLGEDATVDLSAHYYAGGGLPGAEVGWLVTATPGSFVPPGREAWQFGGWSAPWWRWSFPTPLPDGETLVGHTDGGGAHHLGIHFEQLAPAHPMAVHAEATVMDVNRQAWSASSDILLHPADVYVGLQVGRTFVSQGDPVDVKTLVVGIDGAVAPGRSVELRLVRRTWRSGAAGWAEAEEVLDTHPITSGAEPAVWSFHPPAGGTYEVVAVVRDTHGRASSSEVRVWVSGEQLAPDRRVSQEEVVLIPEAMEVAAGGTARVLVQAPFSPADGVWTVQRQGIVSSGAFHMDGTSTTVAIPVDATLIPGFTLQVDLAGAAPRTDTPGAVGTAGGAAQRVASAQGSLEFKVPPTERTLAVKVEPAAPELAPGAKSSVTVEVRDAAGAPVVGAELLVAAVDEAVLALTGYQMPDPMDVYYAARASGVDTVATRGWVWLGRPAAGGGLGMNGDLEGGIGGLVGASGFGRGGGGLGSRGPGGPPMESKAVMLDASVMAAPVARAEAPTMPDTAMKKPGSAEPMAMRMDFAAVALWAPTLVTGADARVTVPLNLPDSLTRYRVMVVAVSGDNHFGHGVADVTARLPLMVRPSPPRFARVGDHFELPVVVQNQTDGPLVVDIAARADNLGLTGPGQRVTVPARDRVEVRFPAAVARAGTADVRVVAASGTLGDAAQLTLPVQTPATTESVATYGTLEAGAVRQPVTLPANVWPQYGGLRVSTSTTQLSALTDAVLYLIRYPYDCNEQLASRILGVAALRDVMKAFAAPDLPSDDTLAATVAADLAQLGRRQGNDGGFAFWRRGDPEWPFLSIHAAHAMVRAKEKGYPVDEQMWQRSRMYLRSIEAHLPRWYSREAKLSLRAYAIYVRALGGDNDVAAAKKLWVDGGTAGLPAEAIGWILPSLHDGKATREEAAALTWLTNHVTETAAGAHFVTGYDDGAYLLLQSDRRADGVLLEALLRVAPKDPLAPKLVQGLLAHRVKGHWTNTSESTFVLLALDRYFHTVEGVEPNLVARVWLGDDVGAEHTFRGRTTEEAVAAAPMAWLGAHAGARDVVVQNDGKGRLYYRIGLDYAPTSERIEPLDVGFTVARRYEAVDKPEDVRRDEAGVWHVRAGARVRVKLDMVATMRRYHVALVDPLPAGFEVVNPALAVSGALPTDSEAPVVGPWWWARTWYEHENLRDDRVEAFTSLLWDGVYAYTYIARATTPGRYVVPPTKAEEMYTPETFGRSGGDVVVVE